MEIVTYPHPTLRYTSKPVRRIDAQLKSIVRNMFDLMYHAKGIGLAANQVDLPLRLFVVNLDCDPDTGEEHVFINPVVSRPRGNDEQEEGCLSLPGLQARVRRPEKIVLNAYTLDGQELRAELDGMLARVVQHELDHLDGILFIDRLSTTGRLAAQSAIEEFETEFEGRRKRGEIPSNGQLAKHLAKWERQYC